jgi:RNA polymerase sigma factor (sigma-70 family)
MDRKLWAEACRIAARRNPAGAGDLAQELAVKTLEQPRAARNGAAWLERVARNATIDEWRVESRRDALLGEAPAADGPSDPEALALGRERRRLIRQALTALPRPQRRAALGRVHGELSFEELGARAGVPAATVRTRFHRALAALRARLTSLRCALLMPGFQASALALAVLATQAPLPPQPLPVALDGDALPRAAAAPHFAAVRVVAAETKPAPRARAHVEPPEAPVQELTFDSDTVEGATGAPDASFIRDVLPLPQSSLIELRRDFVPELLKGLEDL